MLCKAYGLKVDSTQIVANPAKLGEYQNQYNPYWHVLDPLHNAPCNKQENCGGKNRCALRY